MDSSSLKSSVASEILSGNFNAFKKFNGFKILETKVRFVKFRRPNSVRIFKRSILKHFLVSRIRKLFHKPIARIVKIFFIKFSRVFISISRPAESFKSSLENCRSNSRINKTDQRGFPSFFISALRHRGSFASDWNASQNKSEGSQREIWISRASEWH